MKEEGEGGVVVGQDVACGEALDQLAVRLGVIWRVIWGLILVEWIIGVYCFGEMVFQLF